MCKNKIRYNTGVYSKYIQNSSLSFKYSLIFFTVFKMLPFSLSSSAEGDKDFSRLLNQGFYGGAKLLILGLNIPWNLKLLYINHCLKYLRSSCKHFAVFGALTFTSVFGILEPNKTLRAYKKGKGYFYSVKIPDFLFM